ncbi:response regulator, partial [candidate division GN15 bacterium]|nr:response regulator [candidate division GN15 bacterium]
SDGSAALEQYRDAIMSNEPFDVVLMDLTIPGGMGGREAIDKLRQIDPGVVAIVASGYSNDPVMADFEEYGFAGRISKPFNSADLLSLLGTLLPPVVSEQ